MLADTLIDLGAPARRAPEPLRWLADWLPDAERRTLSPADLVRMDNYAGDAGGLHALLPAVMPLTRPVWYEAPVTAQGGTAMVMGYGGVPMGQSLDIGWACLAPASGRIIGPLGPARLDDRGMHIAPEAGEVAERELRSAGGIVLRALLLGLGTPA